MSKKKEVVTSPPGTRRSQGSTYSRAIFSTQNSIETLNEPYVGDCYSFKKDGSVTSPSRVPLNMRGTEKTPFA